MDRQSSLRLLKHKTFIWAVIVSLIVGLVEFGDPLDLALSNLRNKVREQPVSGEVVVVGIDSEAQEALGPWPWDRRVMADLTDRLFEAGAERVFFDIVFRPHGDGDQDFVDAAARHPGRIFVAIGRNRDANGNEIPAIPFADLMEKTTPVSIYKTIKYWNGMDHGVYRDTIGDIRMRSMEAEISRADGAEGEKFPVDYSYSISSIPYLSAVDALNSENLSGDVHGKDVIVGVNDILLGDFYNIPGQNRAAGVFILALGAETLREGRATIIGWWPFWLLSFVGITVFILDRNRTRARIGIGALVVGMICIPALLEANRIFADIVPALSLSMIVTASFTWTWIKARKKREGSTNPVSGLPTFNAALHDQPISSEMLIGARFDHLTDIISTLPPELEGEIVRQVVSRLELATGKAHLKHGDDGNFFWFEPASKLAEIVDQFSALRAIFRTPIRIGEKRFDVDVAFGVDREFEMPLSHRMASVLAAAREADEQGLSWKMHDVSSKDEKEWAYSIMGELDEALERGDIETAFQPKLDLRTRKIVGAEALVRWDHPIRGPVDPAEFVAAAEKHDRIGALTEYVFDRALAVAAQAIRLAPDFVMAINLSPRLLDGRNILDVIDDALERHRVPPFGLIVEITESAAFGDKEAGLSLLETLKCKGIGVSIDDYGTGLSSLEYMRSLPATELKIDKTFTTNLGDFPDNQALIRSTIDLAHTMDIAVVAEGIETAATLDLLATMGCDTGQGYYIGRPMAGADLLAMLNVPEIGRSVG